MSTEDSRARRPRRVGPVPTTAGAPVRDRLEFTPPVTDWLEFLAELLAAEFLRDLSQGGDPK